MLNTRAGVVKADGCASNVHVGHVEASKWDVGAQKMRCGGAEEMKCGGAEARMRHMYKLATGLDAEEV